MPQNGIMRIIPFEISASSNANRLFQSGNQMRFATFENITWNLQILLMGCWVVGVVGVVGMGVDFWWGSRAPLNSASVAYSIACLSGGFGYVA